MEFPYQSLTPADKTIRLINVDLHDNHRHKLIEHVPLYGANSQKYLALSYRWGNIKSETIYINSRPFLVNTNLFDALGAAARYWNHAYPKRTTLYLWADEICINQKDNVEQVGFATIPSRKSRIEATFV